MRLMFQFSSISILGLAGMELIFFIAAGMMLCFVFVSKTALITHECCGCCWVVLAQCQGFLFSHPAPTASGPGVGKRMGGNIARTADPQWPKEYPILCDVMLSNKSSGKGGWSRDVQGLWSLISQATITDAAALLSWRWPSIWPGEGK